ncbi:hypothetical protein AX774_g4574 [Zancudomyces culisetae]|uniref:Altered inheritance of mitochondria protein 41 n=1 Tax=Zancudomyces culisetae TaxID=1213189 RepID=A0A1R1PM63_ZANCU|nr:hypothetical protein AX774_g4574 [Zancudomyces culisetae]|eukprot:OMH81962.1 hypothetical protein AX774_g4574 [Zancudomyces culisetae]
MRAKDTEKSTVIRALLSDITYHEKDKSTKNFAKTNDSCVIPILQRAQQKRFEAAEIFERGNRAELTAAERAQAAIIAAYLPTPLSDPEIETRIDAAVAKCGGSVKNLGDIIKNIDIDFVATPKNKVLELARKRLS